MYTLIRPEPTNLIDAESTNLIDYETNNRTNSESNDSVSAKKLLILWTVFVLFFGTFILTTFLENPFGQLGKLLIRVNKFPKPPLFKMPKEIENLTCAPYFHENNPTLHEYVKNRIRFEDPKEWQNLSMDCESIKSRHYFQTENLYEDEVNFPIAFARAVFKDYYFLEMELASTYAPQNFYCYAIDLKSPLVFHSRMQALANCFPNVFITKYEFLMDNRGKNMGYSHLECIKKLAQFDCKYLILLQNHDISLKTNQELIQIFKWYNGANTIDSLIMPAKKLVQNQNWTIGELNLLKNPTEKQKNSILHFTKSLVQVTISRAMIDFILNDMNITILMEIIESHANLIDGYGMNKDELLFGTLNSEDVLNMPGGFTQHCLNRKHNMDSLTRLTYWDGNRQCISNIWRHSICIFAMEHLPELTESRYLFVNKFLPDEDFGAISCWFEYLHNRTHFNRGLEQLNLEVYLNLAQVRFNREKSELGAEFNASNFQCFG